MIKNKSTTILTILFFIASVILIINLFSKSEEENTLLKINNAIQDKAVGATLVYPEELIY